MVRNRQALSVEKKGTTVFSLLRWLFVELICYTEKQVGGKRNGMSLADTALIHDVSHALVLLQDVNSLQTDT